MSWPIEARGAQGLKILIVKLSSLGDVVHAMPAVQDIRRALPHARIDWVVERAFAPLVQRCVGVARVIPCDLRRWRKAPWSRNTRAQWRDFKRELQAQAYDAVIDLQGLSKSALIAWLARLSPQGQRYALANRTEGSGYEAPTRWVADQAFHITPHVHAVPRSRELCARALGYELPADLFFGLQAAPVPDPAAVETLAQLRSAVRPCVALVHGSSRADKLWPETHWVSLAHKLDTAGFDVALLHGNDAEQARSEALAAQMRQARVWPRLGLDALTDAMAACAGLIGVDSGLSHMAVALDLPHVQIYNFETAWRTGPLQLSEEHLVRTRQCSVYEQPTPSVSTVWQAWQSMVSCT